MWLINTNQTKYKKTLIQWGTWIMGQITATRNLVATKVVRHAGQWHLAASGMGLRVMSYQAGLLTTLHHIHICFPEQGGNMVTTMVWGFSDFRHLFCFTLLINKQRVLMHGHQGWNVRHGLCHIYMIYVYIWVGYSFCLFCCLFIIVTTQFVALYKPSKPKPKPSTYDPPDNHPLAEIQIPILRPEPKQQICHQHANTDHFGK